MNQQTSLYLPLFALIAPFALLPLEIFLPFPFIIEEIAKAALLIPLINLRRTKTQLQLTILMGVLFTLSESVLYLFNIYATGTPLLFAQRLLLTGTLHSLTMLIMILSTYVNKRLFPFGVLIAMVIHYLYNQSLTL